MSFPVEKYKAVWHILAEFGGTDSCRISVTEQMIDCRAIFDDVIGNFVFDLPALVAFFGVCTVAYNGNNLSKLKVSRTHFCLM